MSVQHDEIDPLPAAVVGRGSIWRMTWLLVVVALVVLAMAASVTIGSRDVGWSEIWNGLAGRTDTIGEAAVVKRVPRTLLAVLVGAALGLAGAVMQGVMRNPLADPGLLGINMGASLAIVAAIAYVGLWSASAYIWVAIAGAGVTAIGVYLIGSLGPGGATPLKLTLAGAAVSVTMASFITAIHLPRADISASIRSWQIGGVGGAEMATIRLVLPFLVAGFVLCLLSARSLNSLALGDDIAAALGERVVLVRACTYLGAVILCGAATAACGPIAFVGLVVPHLCRLLIGVDHRWLLPFSMLTGAILLTVADVLGRIAVRPSEVDVGIVTALVGAPFFIYIVRRQRVREL